MNEFFCCNLINSTLWATLPFLSSHSRKDVLTPVSMYQSQVIMCLVADCTNVGVKERHSITVTTTFVVNP